MNDMNVYYKTLDQQHLAPLWVVLKGLVPAEPKSKAVPFQWHFDEVRRPLLEAGELITAEEAERRVLVLENPGWAGKSQITDTLYAGLQLILPGEVAPAHRHTQSALRFVLEGSGGYTAVDGERTTMHPGDFIITPSWTFHDHGHDGTDPVIWMDGLDVPLVSFLKAGFREENESASQTIARPEGDALARYGSGLLPIRNSRKTHTSPVFNYPYDRTREALGQMVRFEDIDPHRGLCLRYVNPTSGDWAIPTLGTTMQLIPANWQGKTYQSTDSGVLVVIEGEITIEMMGADGTAAERFTLKPRDVFALPGWASHRIVGGAADSVVFAFNDRPVQEKLGLWREKL